MKSPCKALVAVFVPLKPLGILPRQLLLLAPHFGSDVGTALENFQAESPKHIFRKQLERASGDHLLNLQCVKIIDNRTAKACASFFQSEIAALLVRGFG